MSLNYMREGVNILGSKYSVNGNLCDNPPKFQFRVNGQASSFEDALHKIFKIDVAQHYEKLKDERALLQKWSRRGHQQKSSNRTILGADYRLKSSLGSLQSMGGTQLGSTFSNPVYNWKQPYSEFEAEEAKNDVDDNAVIEYTIGEEEGQAEEIIENQVSTPFDAHSILSNLKVPRSMWADTLISANLIWHLANYIPNTREVQQLNPLEERNARPPASGRQSLNNISVFTPQWQELTEGYMRSIMYSLLELTSVNPYLYAKLQELDVLTKTEINELVCKYLII